MSTVKINGIDVSTKVLREDIKASIKKGLSGKYAFCPETVKALLDYVEELEECLIDEAKFTKHVSGEESEQTIALFEEHELYDTN